MISFSVAEELRVTYNRGTSFFDSSTELRNDRMTPLFEAVIEATEESILNSLFVAKTMSGKENLKIESLPIQKTIKILKSHNVIE